MLPPHHVAPPLHPRYARGMVIFVRDCAGVVDCGSCDCPKTDAAHRHQQKEHHQQEIEKQEIDQQEFAHKMWSQEVVDEWVQWCTHHHTIQIPSSWHEPLTAPLLYVLWGPLVSAVAQKCPHLIDELLHCAVSNATPTVTAHQLAYALVEKLSRDKLLMSPTSTPLGACNSAACNTEMLLDKLLLSLQKMGTHAAQEVHEAIRRQCLASCLLAAPPSFDHATHLLRHTWPTTCVASKNTMENTDDIARWKAIDMPKAHPWQDGPWTTTDVRHIWGALWWCMENKQHSLSGVDTFVRTCAQSLNLSEFISCPRPPVGINSLNIHMDMWPPPNYELMRWSKECQALDLLVRHWPPILISQAHTTSLGTMVLFLRHFRVPSMEFCQTLVDHEELTHALQEELLKKSGPSTALPKESPHPPTSDEEGSGKTRRRM